MPLLWLGVERTFHPNDHFLESVDNINKCTEVFLFSGYCELTTHHNVDQISVSLFIKYFQFFSFIGSNL